MALQQTRVTADRGLAFAACSSSRYTSWAFGGQDEASRPSRATESLRAWASPRLTASRARSTQHVDVVRLQRHHLAHQAEGLGVAVRARLDRSISRARANRAFRSPGASSTARRRWAIAAANCPRRLSRSAEQLLDRAALGGKLPSLLQVSGRSFIVPEPEFQEPPVRPGGGLLGDQLRRSRQTGLRLLVRIDVKGRDAREERRDHLTIELGAGSRRHIFAARRRIAAARAGKTQPRWLLRR